MSAFPLRTAPGSKVEAAAAGTPAASAGFLPGDEILALNQPPIIAIADVGWVLHRAPASGTLPAKVKRGSESTELRLTLPPAWRNKSDISKRVGTWPMRAMAFGGMTMDDLDDDTREQLGLPNEQEAPKFLHGGQYGTQPPPNQAQHN